MDNYNHRRSEVGVGTAVTVGCLALVIQVILYAALFVGACLIVKAVFF